MKQVKARMITDGVTVVCVRTKVILKLARAAIDDAFPGVLIAAVLICYLSWSLGVCMYTSC